MKLFSQFHEFGWIFVYLFVFGLSDLFVKKYIKTDTHYIIYYTIIGCLGLLLLSYKM